MPDECYFRLQNFEGVVVNVSVTNVISHFFRYVREKAIEQAGADYKYRICTIA